ncbi:MAG TPA: sulfurtransferase [Marmoricola sp.]|nr:sulfurtransferase [Marmoricola sp.]
MSNPLVSADDLGALLGSVTVLDVRYRLGEPDGLPAHTAGHVPGAAYVDLDRDLADPPGHRGRHPLPDPERFGAAMRMAGVSRARPVVVYDDWAGRAAARCWWLLRHHGHDDVRVLDGGWPAWVAAGGAVETGRKSVAPGDYVAAPGRLGVLEAGDVERFAGVLVDARAPERFRGEVEPVDPVGGHIPGAVNVPTEANLDADGRFLAPGELHRIYGPVEGRDPAVYCGSGVTACHDLLALAVLGIEARLYGGSWSEWVTDPRRPVARG